MTWKYDFKNDLLLLEIDYFTTFWPYFNFKYNSFLIQTQSNQHM